MRENPPPAPSATESERKAWDDAFHRHLAERMGWSREDAEVPEWMIDSMGLSEEDEPVEGEGWKAGLGTEFIEDQDVADLPLWQAADAFRAAVMAWVRVLPDDYRGSALVELCTGAIQTVTKLESAHRMGYDIEVLGGNIAKSKRALASANRALTALQHFRGEPFMLESDYVRLYEQGFEVRNALGLHVQQLREMFDRGVG